MTQPKRIQRKRTKGWRMPGNAVSVCRPGKYGNPFNAAVIGNKEAVRLFRWIVERRAELQPGARYNVPYPDMPTIKRELRGKDLACWCPLDKPCHADVLLEVANEPVK